METSVRHPGGLQPVKSSVRAVREPDVNCRAFSRNLSSLMDGRRSCTIFRFLKALRSQANLRHTCVALRTLRISSQLLRHLTVGLPLAQSDFRVPPLACHPPFAVCLKNERIPLPIPISGTYGLEHSTPRPRRATRRGSRLYILCEYYDHRHNLNSSTPW
jgi:hypothetical protein